MRFLNLDALYALALIAGVILLYILRMPRNRRTFSSILVLEMIPEIAKSKRMRRKLRTLLSAVLQVAILAFIVVAWARPYVSTRGLANREIIVLLDRSASMQTLDVDSGLTRFDKAKEVSLGLVSDMDLGDRMLLMAFDSQAEVLANFAGSKIVLRQAIQSVTASDSSTDIQPVIELVREVTKALHHPEIYIVSDGSFDSQMMNEIKTANTSLFYRSIGTSRENVGITRFRARKSLNSDQDFEVVVTIANNTAEKKSFDFELYLNGKIKDVHPMEIEPNASKSEVFTSTIVTGGALEGRLSIEDAFPADNAAYEVIPLPRRQKVLMISEDTENFLVPVVRSNFAVTGYRLPPEKYRPEYDVDVMIFYNYVPQKLPDSHIIYINSTGAAIPVTLKEQIENPSVRHWDSSHPLMNYASLSNLFLTSAKKLTAPDWMEPVAE
ncbi:MAG: BatA and WFA domain-containing protein, partial [Planctomycetota bacterium]|nr:BatA and WFA domain-containing protein [Planctomycetota bacterium]